MTIEPGRHRDDIARILEAVGLRDCSIEIVESVWEWARSVGVEDENPFRVAMALRADGKPLIVLNSQIGTDERESILSGMSVRGFEGKLDRLASDEAFLEHLVLHEAAHLLSPERSEQDCDQWAFEQLGSRISRRTG